MDKKRLEYYKKKLAVRREELMKTIARTQEEGRTADEFVSFLAGVRARPFPVTIAGVGAFGGRDPRVLWAGVEAGEPLDTLHPSGARNPGGSPWLSSANSIRTFVPSSNGSNVNTVSIRVPAL